MSRENVGAATPKETAVTAEGYRQQTAILGKREKGSIYKVYGKEVVSEVELEKQKYMHEQIKRTTSLV